MRVRGEVSGAAMWKCPIGEPGMDSFPPQSAMVVNTRGMNQPAAMGDFLRKRRAGLSPGDVERKHLSDHVRSGTKRLVDAMAVPGVVLGFADDADLAALVGEVTLKSSEFATMWAEHPVENCMSGQKTLLHPDVGSLELQFEVLTMPDDSGHRILTYVAESGSDSAASLARLRQPHPPVSYVGYDKFLFQPRAAPVHRPVFALHRAWWNGLHGRNHWPGPRQRCLGLPRRCGAVQGHARQPGDAAGRARTEANKQEHRVPKTPGKVGKTVASRDLGLINLTGSHHPHPVLASIHGVKPGTQSTKRPTRAFF